MLPLQVAASVVFDRFSFNRGPVMIVHCGAVSLSVCLVCGHDKRQASRRQVMSLDIAVPLSLLACRWCSPYRLLFISCLLICQRNKRRCMLPQ